MGTHALLAPTFMCPQCVQCRLLFFLKSQLLPYPESAGSCSLVPQSPEALLSSPPSHPPTCFGDFIYYLWESILFGDSGFYFSTGFDRYSGKGRGGRVDVSIWFCFMICCGGSVKFSGAVGLEDHVNERPGDGL